MDNTISELISIEEQARQIARKANDFAGIYKAKTDSAITEIRKKSDAEAEKRILELKEAYEVKLAAAVEEMNETFNADLIRIEKAFDENGEDIKKSVFNKIIGENGGRSD